MWLDRLIGLIEDSLGIQLNGRYIVQSSIFTKQETIQDIRQIYAPHQAVWKPDIILINKFFKLFLNYDPQFCLIKRRISIPRIIAFNRSYNQVAIFKLAILNHKLHNTIIQLRRKCYLAVQCPVQKYVCDKCSLLSIWWAGRGNKRNEKDELF